MPKELYHLMESLAWIAFALYVLLRFGTVLEGVIEAFRIRLSSGGKLKAGPFEFSEDLKILEYVNIESSAPVADRQSDWQTERNGIYQENDGIFLAHVIKPSSDDPGWYEIFIFLIRHKSRNLSDIEHAEFFFGRNWGNKVFLEKPKYGLLGISTAAFGPFLCTCRVKMKNGRSIHLNRYIDFEMARAFSSSDGKLA